MATTLVERMRALQGGLPLDAMALAQRRVVVAAGAAVTADNLAERLTQVCSGVARDCCLPLVTVGLQRSPSTVRPIANHGLILLSLHEAMAG